MLSFALLLDSSYVRRQPFYEKPSDGYIKASSAKNRLSEFFMEFLRENLGVKLESRHWSHLISPRSCRSSNFLSYGLTTAVLQTQAFRLIANKVKVLS